jgi:PPOX class probable FMN-dependent enzyme
MKEIKIPIWRQELKAARKKEGKLPSSRWFQLCTINGNNEPRLRTVVFRGWQTESSILIFTDSRSEKVAQLKLNPNAEVLWLFYKSKSQFRFKGKMRELKENMKYWDSLSDRSKSTWFWQHPGKQINKNICTSQIISSDLNKPESFVVLEFEIYSVDLLKLVTPIHKRYVWHKENNWGEMEINP